MRLAAFMILLVRMIISLGGKWADKYFLVQAVLDFDVVVI